MVADEAGPYVLDERVSEARSEVRDEGDEHPEEEGELVDVIPNVIVFQQHNSEHTNTTCGSPDDCKPFCSLACAARCLGHF